MRPQSQRRAILGNTAGKPQPAWKVSVPDLHRINSGNGANHHRGNGYVALEPDPGSKLLVSLLPTDVDEEEIMTLFEQTVGPVKNAFLVYNSQARSKGMAVVHFVRKEDAMVARKMYNHKVIDDRRPIRCELILDADADTPQVASTSSSMSLIDRMSTSLSPPPTGPRSQRAPTRPAITPPVYTRNTPNSSQPRPPKPSMDVPLNSTNAPPTQPSGFHRKRFKKGPKRIQKKLMMMSMAKTREQLDQEMDDWRASNPA